MRIVTELKKYLVTLKYYMYLSQDNSVEPFWNIWTIYIICNKEVDSSLYFNLLLYHQGFFFNFLVPENLRQNYSSVLFLKKSLPSSRHRSECVKHIRKCKYGNLKDLLSSFYKDLSNLKCHTMLCNRLTCYEMSIWLPTSK